MFSGKEIRNIRIKRGMTQKQLADKLGTTPQNIAQYENGKRNPKPDTQRRIAKALGVDPVLFWDQQIDAPEITEDNIEFYKELRALYISQKELMQCNS